MSTDQIPITDTPFEIAGRTLRSRLILGTGGFPRLETLADAIRATRADGNRSVNKRSTCCVPRPRLRNVSPPQRRHRAAGSSLC